MTSAPAMLGMLCMAASGLMLAAAQATCPAFSSNRIPTPQYALGNCTWYSPSSCCHAPEAAELTKAAMMPAPSAPIPARCSQLLTALQCWPCSPSQSDFFGGDGLVTVCQSFCDDVAAACVGATFGIEGEALPATGAALCQLAGFRVATADTECYSNPAVQEVVTAAPAHGLARATLSLAVASIAGLAAGGSQGAALAAAAASWALLPARAAASAASYDSMAGRAVATASDPFCPYFNNRAPSPQPGLRYCPWFRDSACCTAREEASLMGGASMPFGVSAECAGALRYLSCWPCSEHSATFYSLSTWQLSVCPSMCATIYARCASSPYKGSTFAAAFEDANDMCRGLGFEVPTDGVVNKNCFGIEPGDTLPAAASARSVHPGVWVLALALALLLGGVTPASAFPAPTPQPAALAHAAAAIRDHAHTLTQHGARADALQELYDSGKFQVRARSVADKVAEVRDTFQGMFSGAVEAVRSARQAALTAYEGYSASSPAPGAADMVDSDVPGAARARLAFDPMFNTHVDTASSWLKFPDEVDRRREPVQGDAAWSAALTSTWRGQASRYDGLRWSYLGAATGVFRNYPGMEWSTDHRGLRTDYDPRLRPWYQSGISGPKDVLLVVDCTSSARPMKSLIMRVVDTVLGTLSIDDRVVVVCNQYTWYEYGAVSSERHRAHYKRPFVVSCSAGASVPVTPDTRAEIMRNLGSTDFSGSSSPVSALRLGMDLLTSVASRPMCHGIVLYVTDGAVVQPQDEVRCGFGRRVRSCSSILQGWAPAKSKSSKSSCSTRYEPGPVCRTDVSSAVGSMARVLDDQPVTTMGIVAHSTLYGLAPALACNVKGTWMRVGTGRDVLRQLSPYFTYLAKSTVALSDVTFTAPYVDAFGLGLIISASSPLFTPSNDLLGVVAVDITLADMESLVTDSAWGNVYGFLMESTGRTLVHPLLKPVATVSGPVVFPDISTLEQAPEDPSTAFANVRTRMLSSATGSATVSKLQRMPKGDDLAGYATEQVTLQYAWAHIPGSKFVVALVAQVPNDAQAMEQQDVPLSRLNASGTDWYHRFDLYPAAQAPATHVPGVPPYGDMPIVPDASAWMVSPRGYCDPALYSKDFSGAASFPTLQSTMAAGPGRPAAGACQPFNSSMRFNFSTRPTVRPDVQLTSFMNRAWREAPALPSGLKPVWRYLGSSSGVARFFPGTRLPRLFQPHARPWYERAVAAGVRAAALSAPYLDAVGGARIITAAQAVAPGMPASAVNCSTQPVPWAAGCACTGSSQCASSACGSNGMCNSTEVAAVAAVDLVYNSWAPVLESVLDGTGVACGHTYRVDGTTYVTSCVLIDEAGLVVYDKSFQEASVAMASNYSQVSLGSRYGAAAAAMQRDGVLVRQEYVEFQGRCEITQPEQRVPITVEGLGMLPSAADAFAESKGWFPPFDNSYACIQDVASYKVVLDAPGHAQGETEGCGHVAWTLTRVPATNLYLTTITQPVQYRGIFGGQSESMMCNTLAAITTSTRAESVNGTCAAPIPTEAAANCPARVDYPMLCPAYEGAHQVRLGAAALTVVILAALLAW